MKLIVGLGNPGSDYARTRHNAGFMAVDRLAQRHGLGSARTKFHAGLVEGSVAGERCVLLQPMTFMNRSGLAVSEAMRFYKLEPADLMVIVDETALPLGTIRLRASGSAGGHNGLTDIQQKLGTADYPRLRIGIDNPPPRVPKKDWVLSRFTDDHLDDLQPALLKACDAIVCWIESGIDKAMSLYNA